MVSLNDCTTDGAIAKCDLTAAMKSAVEEPGTAGTNAELDATAGGEHVFLKAAGQYTAYAVDLEFLWRWEIYLEDDRLIQHGASLSLASATEAVGHVLAYFAVRDSNLTRGTADVHCP